MLNAELAGAYFYNITPSCANDICIEGEIATWNVVISNSGKSEVEYTGVELFDTANSTLFASLSLPFYPLSDKRGDLIVVRQNEKATVNLTGRLPKANYGQLLVYYPCFTTTITDSYIIAKENKYESRQCYNANETMQVLECISSNNCNSEEYCSFNSCLKLRCTECQYTKNHACADYKCCSHEQCKFDESCANNTCRQLGCNVNEYIQNHTCIFLNCAMDEMIMNKSCSKLNCSFDEAAFNHTCKKLDCSQNESIMDHACRLLQCKENEYAENHSCRPLQCSGNETVLNHACIPLDCYFFQDAVGHACRNNRQVILKSALEIIIIIAIIVFFVLDFRKYESRHAENPANADKDLAKKAKSENPPPNRVKNKT